MLAVPADSPLGARASVRLSDLHDQPLIGFERRCSPDYFDALHAAVRASAVRPRTIAELTTETDMLALVSTGAGIAIVNACQRWRPPAAVRFVPVDDLAVSLQLALVQPAGKPSPTVRQFADILSDLAPPG